MYIMFSYLCSDVHKETTENIRVTVIPFYMGYRENQQVGNILSWTRVNF